MTKRSKTKKIKLGDITIGGNNNVLIQTMLKRKTSFVNDNIEEILKLEKAGLDIIRLSVLDEEDALSLKLIKDKINIPLVADIHFSKELALTAIRNGADAIRINPGNIREISSLKEIINECIKYNTTIRIGINTGSFDNEPEKKLVKSLLKEVRKIEKMNFKNIVLSIKSSDIDKTINTNLLLAKKTKYPLHIGLTESGSIINGIVKSVIALEKILNHNIGNTIRISLNASPLEEIRTCKSLLKTLKIRNAIPEIISCPTCGRMLNNNKYLLDAIVNYLDTVNKNIKVAVMGCVVNGPGEAKDSDLAIFPISKNEFVIYKNGLVYKKIQEKEALEEMISVIDSF